MGTHQKTSTLPEQQSFPVWIKNNGVEVILTIIAIGILILFFYFIYQKAVSEKPVAKYLPDHTTIGFVTMSVDKNSTDFSDFNQLVASTGSGSFLSQVMKIDENVYQHDIAPWLGKKVSLAYLQDGGGIASVWIVAYTQKDQAIQYFTNQADLNSLPRESYQGNSIWAVHLPYKGYFSVMDQNIVYSSSRTALQSVLDVSNGKRNALSGTDRFISVQKNLSPSAFLFAYVDYPNMIMTMKSLLSSRKEYRDMFALFAPLEQQIQGVGFSLMGKQEGETKGWYGKWTVFGAYELFHRFVNTQRSPLTGENHISHQTQWYLGGFHFLEGIHLLAQGLGTTSADAEIILEGLCNQWLHTYIAPTIGLSDVIDLNRGEYALLYNKVKTTDIYGLLGVFQLQNEQTAEKNLKKWFMDFQQNSELLYTPAVRDLVLPDETVGKELYLEPKEVTEQQEVYHGGILHYLQVKNDLFSPGYSILDGKLYIFTHKDLLSSYFDTPQEGILPVHGDVQGWGSIHLITNLFFPDHPALNKLSEQLGNISWAVKFFDSGLVGESVLQVKR